MDLHYGKRHCAVRRLAVHISSRCRLYGNDFWDNFCYRDVSERHHTDGTNHVSFAHAERLRPEKRFLRSWIRPCPCSPSANRTSLLYQAGADPYFEDPYSPLALDHDDLYARDRRVFEFTKEHGIAVAWVLAGGYTSDVSKVVRVHLNTFAAWRDVYGG